MPRSLRVVALVIVAALAVAIPAFASGTGGAHAAGPAKAASSSLVRCRIVARHAHRKGHRLVRAHASVVCIRGCAHAVAKPVRSAHVAWFCMLPCPLHGATGSSGTTGATAAQPCEPCPPIRANTGATGSTGATTTPAVWSCAPPCLRMLPATAAQPQIRAIWGCCGTLALPAGSTGTTGTTTTSVCPPPCVYHRTPATSGAAPAAIALCGPVPPCPGPVVNARRLPANVRGVRVRGVMCPMAQGGTGHAPPAATVG